MGGTHEIRRNYEDQDAHARGQFQLQRRRFILHVVTLP